MPLSEHEQRILQQIERSFYEHDPDFADRVRSETVYRHAGRNCKWSALGFVAGFVVLLLTFSSSLLLALAGLLAMFFSAIVFERNLRRMGRAGIADISRSVKERNFPAEWTKIRRNIGERFKRPS